MEKIKTGLCLLLMIAASSCRQNDEETTLLPDVISTTLEMNRKSADSNTVTNGGVEIENYNNALLEDEEPKIPPRK